MILYTYIYIYTYALTLSEIVVIASNQKVKLEVATILVRKLFFVLRIL